jgi:hypothetical protein
MRSITQAVDPFDVVSRPEMAGARSGSVGSSLSDDDIPF